MRDLELTEKTLLEWASLHKLVKRLVICREDFIFINEAHHVQSTNNLDLVSHSEKSSVTTVPRIPPLGKLSEPLWNCHISAQRVKGQGKY